MAITRKLLLLLFLVGVQFCSAGDWVGKIRTDTNSLSKAPCRTTGSAGHREARTFLASRIQALPGVKLVRQPFTVLLPQTRKAFLRDKAGREQAIYPLWPDNVRLNTTPAEGIAGTPVYVKNASFENLPPASLRGQIAVMEMSGYGTSTRWKRVFDYGARALLLLGGPKESASRPSDLPVYKPRYYIPQGPLADALRQGQGPSVTLICQASWEPAEAENLIAVLPGADGFDGRPFVLAARYDAMSIVPDQAPGADNAVDAAFLLNMLEYFSKHRPRRGVVFAFVDAFGYNQLGMRQLLAMLSATPEDNTRRAYEDMDLERREKYRDIQKQIAALGTDPLSALRQLNDKARHSLLQRYLKDVFSPEILRLRDETAKLRQQKQGLPARKQAATEAKLKQRLDRLYQLNRLLSDIILEGRVRPENRKEAVAAWNALCNRAHRQLAMLEGRAAYFKANDRLRRALLDALGRGGPQGVCFPFLFGVDLADSGLTAGPALWCESQSDTLSKPAKSFVRWLKGVLADEKTICSTIPPERLQYLGLGDAEPGAVLCQGLNREAVEASVDPRSFSPEPLALLSGQADGFQMNGVTWSTLEGVRLRMDTPQDRVGCLAWDRLVPQFRSTALLLELLLNDKTFTSGDGTSTGWPRWRMVHGSLVSESVAETIPRTPVADMLVTHISRYGRTPSSPTRGVRGYTFTTTGVDGSFLFAPTKSLRVQKTMRRKINAYALADDGRIVKSISAGNSMIAGRIASNFELRESPPMKPLRAVTFECVEINGPVFRDPRYQAPLNGYSLIDVVRGGQPKRYRWEIIEGEMSGLLAPDTRWQLILRVGTANNRMAVLNIPQDLNQTDASLRQALSHGFAAEEELPELPEMISARDFFHIDEWRLRRLEEAGVICNTIRGIHGASGRWLKAAKKAYEEDDGAAYKQAAVSALANEIRVYHAVQDQANDVTRGAIFLLLLLVPFSVAMERLLFASAGIARQMALAIVVFLVMGAILWSFHPGFRITGQPAVILLAFLVLLLSLSVIVLVLNKFRADMEELRRGSQAEASGAQTGRGGVITSAVWLGIANMRKRMVRTLLTGLTIVLVTFSLLCFTSSSTYQDKRVVTLDTVQPPHGGALVQHPAYQALDEEMEESIQNVLGGVRQVVGRYWVTSDQTNWRLHVRNPKNNTLASLKAGLGLRPSEDRLSGVARHLKQWDAFAKGQGCYVATAVAEKLGVQAGDALVVAGVPLKLLSTFDGRALENDVRKMDGTSLLPIDYTIERDDRTPSQAAVESELSDVNMLMPDPDLQFVSGDEVLVLPAGLAKRMGGTLRSVAVLAKEGEAVSLAREMMEVMVYPVYYGEGNKVKAMVSTPLMPRAPRKLLIPILIAVLIIFNTMLNSIAERRKEIHIYSSLGLAPRHIGVLFLAEALTYGLMGSVFGYIIGQGVATILTGLNLMGGITLNYSGSSVIMTMGLVLLVVMISSLVPAFMAAKVASPSSDLDWKVPKPEKGAITDLLPFTVSPEAAPGLIAYLSDFVDAHRDGAIGNFTSHNLRVEKGTGDTVVQLKATAWLAPYDLGVRQDFTVEVRRGTEDVCSLHVHLEHGAGPERSWWRLNRTFLGDLRNQLLGWRNITPERMLSYIHQAEANE